MVQAGQGLRHDQDADPGRDQFDRVGRGRRALEGGLAGQPVPAEDVVQGVQDHLVGEVVEGHLVRHGHQVVLGGHDDGGLGVEGDRAEHRTVDRQADQGGVGGAVAQEGGRLGDGRLQEGEGVSGWRSPHTRTHLAGITPGT